VTQGLVVNGEKSYLRQFWNWVDLVILIFQYVCFFPNVEQFKVVKTFRILRALRLVSRNEGLKLALRALLYAIPNILNITVIMLLYFLIFAVIAVSYFKGKLFYCMEPIPMRGGYELKTKWDCLSSGGLWENQAQNFDNVGIGLITLFMMSTTEGWSDVLFNTLNS
jgi:hypothetical protein